LTRSFSKLGAHFCKSGVSEVCVVMCYCYVFVQLEQYKLVSQSFEKRVLDLQKEVKSKDDEIASLQKADSGFENSANHVRLDGWCLILSAKCVTFLCYCAV